MTIGSVESSWARIEAWLRANAVGTYASLRPPASDQAIVAAQQAIGVEFPHELVESLLRHDGNENYSLIPGVYALLSTENMVQECVIAKKIEESFRAELKRGGETMPLPGGYATWHPKWVPFASDSAGSHFVLDTSNGEQHGCVGQRDELGSTTFDARDTWSSLAAMLMSLASALETGEAICSDRSMYQRTVVDGTHLEWIIVG
ncbi:SMI1/KNR4 family protein [Streptomyces sp. MAR4 CNY-716]